MSIILFVGGGSVGHIAPSIAVWEELSDSHHGHFICSPRITDAPFLEKNQVPYTVFNAPRIGLLLPLQMPLALWRALRIIRQTKPDLVFSTGGYISAPLCIAAWLKKIPIILYQPEVHLGLASQLISKLATRILDQESVGYPLRQCVMSGNRERGLEKSGLSGQRPVLLVIGGSQGAETFNNLVQQQLAALLELCDIIHITGQGKAAAKACDEHYFHTEFASEDLPDFYALANVALSRAGAGSIAELEANSIPALLVPLHAAQHRNAMAATKRLSSWRLVQQVDIAAQLLPTVTKLLQTKFVRSEAKKSSSRQIADIVVQTLAST